MIAVLKQVLETEKATDDTLRRPLEMSKRVNLLGGDALVTKSWLSKMEKARGATV